MNPDAFKSTHVVVKHNEPASSQEARLTERLLAQKKGNSTIIEQELEESEVSHVNIETAEAITKREIEEKTKVVQKYKRIDQITLNRVGLKHKQLLNEDAIDHVYNFTQLQRFRQNRDLLAFDKSKQGNAAANPIESDSSDSDSDDEPEIENRNVSNRGGPAASHRSQASSQLQSQRDQIKQQRKQVVNAEKLKELENKWWLQGEIEAVKRAIQTQKDQAQKQIEKDRYLTAFKALVSDSEKGQTEYRAYVIRDSKKL